MYSSKFSLDSSFHVPTYLLDIATNCVSPKLGCTTCRDVSRTAGPQRYQGMRDSIAREWVDATIVGFGANKTDIQHSLRMAARGFSSVIEVPNA